MLSIATDENNDIYLDKFGNLATVTGLDAVAQVCRNTVLTTYGELILMWTAESPISQRYLPTRPILNCFKTRLFRPFKMLKT